jgi:uncharacterized membrane protein HdeD (DUF308 family)
VLAFAAAAALLPLAPALPPAVTLGLLLTFAGCLEMLAGAGLHGRSGNLVKLAAGVTVLAGLLFLAWRNAGLFSLSWIVTAWLLLRGLLLLVAGCSLGATRGLPAIGGALTDVALGVVILLNLPVAALVVSLFGPTPEIVASFTFVVAASLLVTGASLIAQAILLRRAVQPIRRSKGTHRSNRIAFTRAAEYAR